MGPNSGDPSVGPHFADVSERALVDYPSELHVSFGRWIDDEQMAAAEVAAPDAAVEKITRDVAPYDVEALHDSILPELGALSNHRGAPVACDHEVGAKIARAGGGIRADSDHAIIFEDQIAHRDTALERKAGKLRGLGDDHFEHRGLRHYQRLDVESGKRELKQPPLTAKHLECLERLMRQ